MATLTQEEFNRLVQEVTDEIQNKSNDAGQFELAESLTGITSLPVLWNSGDTWQLKRVLISLLKGADGREIELRETATAIQWRYAAGDWADLFTFQKLLQPATDLIDTLQGVIDVWNNTTKSVVEDAVSSANTAAQNANEKAAAANSAAGNATSAAQGAGQATDAANTAAQNANTKANEAQTAANNANAKATLAQEAATNANAKATLAQTAATNANEKAQLASTAADKANIAAENVKDGKTPQFAIGTVEKTAPGGDPVVSLTDAGSDASGNPKKKIDFVLPQGEQGRSGVHVGSSEEASEEDMINIDPEGGEIEEFATKEEIAQIERKVIIFNEIFTPVDLAAYPILSNIKYIDLSLNSVITNKVTLAYLQAYNASVDYYRLGINFNDEKASGNLNATYIDVPKSSAIDKKNVIFRASTALCDITVICDFSGAFKSTLNLLTQSTGVSISDNCKRNKIIPALKAIDYDAIAYLENSSGYDRYLDKNKKTLVRRNDLNEWHYAYYFGNFIICPISQGSEVHNVTNNNYYQISGNTLVKVCKNQPFFNVDYSLYPILNTVKSVYIERNEAICQKLTLTNLSHSAASGTVVRAIFNADDRKSTDGTILEQTIVIDVLRSSIIDLKNVVLEKGTGQGYIKIVIDASDILATLNVQTSDTGILANSSYFNVIPEEKRAFVSYNAYIPNITNSSGYDRYLDKNKKTLAFRSDLNKWHYAYYSGGRWNISTLQDGVEMYNEIDDKPEEIKGNVIIARQKGSGTGDSAETYNTLKEMYADENNEYFVVGNQRYRRIAPGGTINSFQRLFYHRTPILDGKATIIKDIPVPFVIMGRDLDGEVIALHSYRKKVYKGKGNEIGSFESDYTEYADLSEIQATLEAVYLLNNGSLLILEKTSTDLTIRGGLWIRTKEGVLSKVMIFKNEYISPEIGWSFEFIDNVILMSEYGNSPSDSGLGTKANATCVYMSEDYGMTWSTIFDGNLHPDYPNNKIMHIHAIHYDRFWNRLWLCSGDGSGVKPSNKKLAWTDDFKNPTANFNNWKTIDLANYNNSQDGGSDPYNSFQGLNMYSTNDFLLIAGDDWQNCIYRVAKSRKMDAPVLEQVYYYTPGSNNQITQFARKMIRLDNGLILIPLSKGDNGLQTKLVTTFDGIEFHLLFETEEGDHGGGNSKYTSLIPSANGNIGFFLASTATGMTFRYVEFAKVELQ